MVAGIKLERWPSSNRNRWPPWIGIRSHDKLRDAITTAVSLGACDVAAVRYLLTEAGLHKGQPYAIDVGELATPECVAVSPRQEYFIFFRCLASVSMRVPLRC